MKRPMNLNLEADIVAAVDAAIGRRSRSAWVRGAIILRLAVDKALRANADDVELARTVRALYHRATVEEAEER